MAWFSILPASLSFVETWFIRLFLLLGFIAIGPWIALLIYDVVYYVVRFSTYEVPYVGGRARNRPRPRAPSLTERPNGNKRSVNLQVSPATVGESTEDLVDGLKKRSSTTNETGHRRIISDG